MPQIGPLELMVVAVIALVVFGPRRLPEMARTIGKAMSEFKRQAADLKGQFDVDLDDAATSGPASPATGTPVPEPVATEDPVPGPGASEDPVPVPGASEDPVPEPIGTEDLTATAGSGQTRELKQPLQS